MSKSFMLRSAKFFVVGVVCTFISYVTFITVLSISNYFIANLCSWISGTLIGFTANRSFTYEMKTFHKVSTQFGFFLIGSLCQFFLATFCYWVLIGRWQWNPTAAFIVTLCITVSFMLTYLELVAFRSKHTSNTRDPSEL